jgi:DNA polymerase I
VRTGRLVRTWLVNEPPANPPFSTDPDTLFVAYYASAELSCFLALGWPAPLRILDLYAEFRCLTAGKPLLVGPDGKRHSLLAALTNHGLDCMAATEKEEMQQLSRSAKIF